ncbi:MAG: hypothetical protein K2H23_02585, partial [Oscillospiraceae bacterium]|nr:hypothetical protein [Oscillospiraceae bacterium]
VMYVAVAVFAFTLGLFMLTILILSFLAPISSPLFGLLPLLFICIAVFIAVIAYYNMIFRKTGNADDAVSASLGLLELSFTVCFVVESVKLSRFSYDRGMHTYWYAEFLPYSIIITMIAAMIKAGCAFASVLAVRTMYLSEKCSERSAAVASSIIMSVLTVGMDTIIILIL